METNIRNAGSLLLGLVLGLIILSIFYMLQYSIFDLDFSVSNFDILHQKIEMLCFIDFSPILLALFVLIIDISYRGENKAINKKDEIFSEDFNKAFDEIDAESVVCHRNNSFDIESSNVILTSFKENEIEKPQQERKAEPEIILEKV